MTQYTLIASPITILGKCYTVSPCCPHPTLYLEVLSDSLLSEAFGQDHQAPLQLVTQGHLSCGSLVLFSNDIEHWILQDNWVVLGNPGEEAECSESEAAYPFHRDRGWASHLAWGSLVL